MLKVVNLILLSILYSSCLQQENSDVVMIAQMTRHGSRAPLTPIFNETWIEEVGFGELTPTGMRQHYQLGKNLRLSYSHLFNRPLKVNEYFVESTDVNRTLMSAFSHLTGLFGEKEAFAGESLPFENSNPNLQPPQKNFYYKPSDTNFNSSLPNGLKPFVIHSKNYNTDDTLSLDSALCPPNKKEIDKAWKDLGKYLGSSQKFMDFLDKIKTDFKIPKSFKEKSTPFSQCYSIGDFFMQNYNNNPNSSQYGRPGDDTFDFFSRCYWLGNIITYNSTKVAKVTATPYLQKVIQWFDKKSLALSPNSTLEFPMKLAYFSAHDDTLDSFLVASKTVNASCMVQELRENKVIEDCPKGPPVASQIIWELIQRKKTHFFVRVKYNGDYLNICEKEGAVSPYECTLAEFKYKLNEDYIVHDYREYCNLDGAEDNNIYSYLLFLAVIILILIFVTFIILSALIWQKYSLLKQVEELGDQLINDEKEYNNLESPDTSDPPQQFNTVSIGQDTILSSSNPKQENKMLFHQDTLRGNSMNDQDENDDYLNSDLIDQSLNQKNELKNEEEK